MDRYTTKTRGDNHDISNLLPGRRSVVGSIATSPAIRSPRSCCLRNNSSQLVIVVTAAGRLRRRQTRRCRWRRRPRRSPPATGRFRKTGAFFALGSFDRRVPSPPVAGPRARPVRSSAAVRLSPAAADAAPFLRGATVTDSVRRSCIYTRIRHPQVFSYRSRPPLLAPPIP